MPTNNNQGLYLTFRPRPTLLNLIGLLMLLCVLPGREQLSAELTPGSAGLVELTSGVSLVREIAGGATQAFAISLGPHQFLQLSIDKGDLNLSLTLYEPGGGKLVEQTSHGYEAMETALVANSPSVYRLEVCSLESDKTNKSFTLKVDAVRRATTEDEKESAPRSAFAGASQLRADWSEASLRSAIKKYTEAWLAWRSAGNVRSAAAALRRAAEVHFALGEYRQALGHYQKAAQQSKQAGDRLGEAMSLSQVGRLYSYLGDNDRAQRYLKRELNYYSGYREGHQSLPVKHAYAEALLNMGEVYYSKGDLVKSSEDLQSSLKLFGELGDRRGEARATLFIGYLSDTIGEVDKALTQFNQALTLYRAVSDRMGEALSLTAIGITHSLKRDEDYAIKMHREAMNIFRTIGDLQGEGITLNGVGQAYENLNEYQLALDNYEHALKLFQANGSVDFASAALYQIAGIYRSTGESKRALAYYGRCIRMSRVAKARRREVYALNDVAAIYAAQGNRVETLAQYRKILKFYGTVSDHRGQAITLNNIGDFLSSLGDKQAALSIYRQALPLSQHAGERGVEISTLYNIARAERDVGALDDARSHVEESIRIIEDLRTNVASPDFRSSYFAGIRKHYDLYIDLLMRLDQQRAGQGFAAEALQASERARARSLLEILAEAGADIRQNVDPAILKRERELQGLLRAEAQYRMEISSNVQNQTEAGEVARTIDLLREEYEGIQAQLRDQNPRYTALTQLKPLKLEEIQAELLDGNTMLLEYALGDERSYLWAVTQDSLSGYELPPRATLEEAAREVYKLLTARQPIGGKIDPGYQARVEESDREYYERADTLSRMLLEPVANQLGNKRLVVVTEGALQYIPLDSLPEPSMQGDAKRAGSVPQSESQDRPLLISQHEIVTLPSISTLAAIRREKRRASLPGKLVAVLADPVFDSDDDRVQNVKDLHFSPALSDADQAVSQRAFRDFIGLKGNSGTMRLTHASEEADAILATAPHGTMVAKGFDANRETAMSSQVGQYQIVHFATHGFVNSQHPELSGIVLSMLNREGISQNGFLQLHDIYNLNLSADLTVLSACDTGLGKDIKGEGLIGLTRGFMYAGSKSVVASLWKVDDSATAQLMGNFYKAMLQDGMAPARALRSAKESIRQQEAWRAPYFWAGFILQGEYNERINVSRTSWLPTVALVVLTLVLISISPLIFKVWRRISTR